MARDINEDEQRSRAPPPPEDEHRKLLTQLGRNKEHVKIPHRFIFTHDLRNANDFTKALSRACNVKQLTIGASNTLERPIMNITRDAEFNKFCEAIGNLKRLHTLRLGSFGVYGEISSKIVAAVPHVKAIFLSLAWRGQDLKLLIEALSSHDYNDLNIRMTNENLLSVDGYGYGLPEKLDEDSVNHRSASENLLSLLKSSKVKGLYLKGINFTLDECNFLAKAVLSSETRVVDQLVFERCTFHEEGSKLVTNALAETVWLKRLTLTAMFQDEEFCNKLISSIPLNTSLSHLKIKFDSKNSTVGKDGFLVELIQAIATRNNTLKRIAIDDALESAPILDIVARHQLYPFIQRNYDLERVLIRGKASHTFEIVHRLNRAGRRYLIEDSTSKSACIDVLSKVSSGRIDSLFFHLRENPALFVDTT